MLQRDGRHLVKSKRCKDLSGNGWGTSERRSKKRIEGGDEQAGIGTALNISLPYSICRYAILKQIHTVH